MMFGYWIGLYAVIFLILFADFYVKSYRKHPKTTSSAKSSVETASPSNGTKKLQ